MTARVMVARILLAHLLLSSGFFTAAMARILHVPSEYVTIQLAVNAASTGDTVLVRSGTYSGTGNRGILFHNKTIVLRSESGSGTTRIETAGESFCSYNFWDQTTDGVVDGFTIHSVGDPQGHSAIEVNTNATPTIRDCVFTESQGRDGVGIYCYDSSPTIEECSFLNNVAFEFGGAVYCIRSATPVFRQCIFSNNWAGAGGAVFCRYDAEPVFIDCVFQLNRTYSGGALECQFGGRATLRGCTLTQNHANDYGGAINIPEGTVTIERSIVWGNAAGVVGDDISLYETNDSFLNLLCSCINQAGLEGTGTIVYEGDQVFTDPQFCTSDLTIRYDSPCTPEHSPCGLLVGARGVGCYPPGLAAACCMGEQCLVLTEPNCTAQGGFFLPNESDCSGVVCGSVPTQVTSWGQIKAAFR
jgi:hypothetical protein